MNMRSITMASLFDGIGAFPYAASIFGVKPIWASEILPAAISVTRRHFPDMAHVGDIIKLNGGALPPVDVVVFGSPCQDLSVASGKRAGLAGARSGLFMEAIRIIDEMRCATNGKYPRYAIFENVPGCFSSNGRRDYQAVLEAFVQADIPMPQSDRWANAGLVRSGRAHIAWCVFDACRGFGLAQRRKRVFVICDFGKGHPEQILLIPKSLRWYPPQSFGEGESVAATAESGTGNASTRVYGICSLNSNSMLSSNPLSGVYEAATSRTPDQNCGYPGVNQGGMTVVAFNGGASPQAGSIACSERVSPTIKSASSGLRTPCVCEPAIARTLTARGDSSPCADRGQNIVAMPSITNFVRPEITGTLYASEAGLSRPAGMASETDLAVAIDCRNLKETQEVSGTLQAKPTPGYSLNYQNPIRCGYIVRRLTPTECERLMGLPDDYTAFGHDGVPISDSKRYSMLGNSIATTCAAYIMQGIVEQYEKGE